MIEKTVDSVVIILLNSKNEILLQKKDREYPWFPGQWCLFGGGIEQGEDPVQTIIRELEEELGSRPQHIQLFKKTTYSERYSPDRKRDGDFHVYAARFTGKISEISLEEGAGFAFFNREELKTIPIVDYNLRVIEEYYTSLESQSHL